MTAGQGCETTDFVSFVYFLRTSCDVMFLAALMSTWLINHQTTSGDKHRHDLCVWCCGSEEKEVHPFSVARGALSGGGGGGGGGLVSAAEHVGVKFSQELR